MCSSHCCNFQRILCFSTIGFICFLVTDRRQGIGWLAAPLGSHNIRSATPAGEHEVALVEAQSKMQAQNLLLLQSDFVSA